MDLHFDCKSKYSRTPFGQISSCLMARGRCRCSVRGVISVCLLGAPRDTLRLGRCHSSSERGPVAARCFPCFEGTAATVAGERGWPPGRRGPPWSPLPYLECCTRTGGGQRPRAQMPSSNIPST